MSTTELRNHLHQLIDRINNDTVLAAFYKLMSKYKDAKDSSLWTRLSEEEQRELLLSDMDSNDMSNLVSQEEIKKKHSKWL